jgi:hypothetical protein
MVPVAIPEGHCVSRSRTKTRYRACVNASRATQSVDVEKGRVECEEFVTTEVRRDIFYVSNETRMPVFSLNMLKYPCKYLDKYSKISLALLRQLNGGFFSREDTSRQVGQVHTNFIVTLSCHMLDSSRRVVYVDFQIITVDAHNMYKQISMKCCQGSCYSLSRRFLISVSVRAMSILLSVSRYIVERN